MLYFQTTNVSKKIHVNTSASKECDILTIRFFLNYSFKFQPNVCNRCYHLLVMSTNLSNIAILNIGSSDYPCIINLISKNEAINLMQNADFTRKKRNIVRHKNLLSHIKVGKKI